MRAIEISSLNEWISSTLVIKVPLALVPSGAASASFQKPASLQKENHLSNDKETNRENGTLDTIRLWWPFRRWRTAVQLARSRLRSRDFTWKIRTQGKNISKKIDHSDTIIEKKRLNRQNTWRCASGGNEDGISRQETWDTSFINRDT